MNLFYATFSLIGIFDIHYWMLLGVKLCKSTCTNRLLKHPIGQVHHLHLAFEADFGVNLSANSTLVPEYLADSKNVGTRADCKTDHRWRPQ